jgi:DNA-binding response OmpR family regulator
VRILVADDSDTVSSLVSDILTAEGHEVDVARTGIEAWDRLTSSPYGAILCDVVLPGLDGLRLYRRVADQRPDIVSRFVLMSGRTEDVRQFAQATGAAFLAKPFRVGELLACVDRCEQR